jgi:hypothetical protein
MIRARFILVAETVIRDTETDQVSIISLFEGVSAERFPLFIPKLTVLVMLERDASDPPDGASRLTVSLGSRALASGEIQLDFGAKLRNRVIINFSGLLIPEPGAVSFAFGIRESEVARTIVGFELGAPRAVTGAT